MKNITQVQITLSSVDVSKSTGYDRMSNKLLKDSSDIIAYSLAMIFNTSINTGIFPNYFKTAIISPIHKAGCRTDCNNCRRILILSSVAKILEKLITQNLETYPEENEILVQQQAGLRKKHCTQTSLRNITNQWFVNMDKGSLNGVIFLDEKTTFDCVDHSIFLRKLYHYGEKRKREKPFKWPSPICLIESKFAKLINLTLSDKRIVKRDVPQGLNLGLLLFLLHINDLPNCLSTSAASMFADDTIISIHSTLPIEIQDYQNHDLENIHQWLLAKKLTLNREKTEYMIIGSRQKLSKMLNEPEIHVGETTIKQVRFSKTIGVVIDEHFTLERQIENIQRKISKGIGMKRRMKKLVPKTTLTKVYNAIVLPHSAKQSITCNYW